MTVKKPFRGVSYQRPGEIYPFGSGKPSEPVLKAAAILSAGAAVLDMGCGEGRNALYLAGLGLKVTAFDISVSSVGRLMLAASQKHLTINASVADMREYEIPGQFDLIINMGCLHMVKRAEWQDIIPLIQKATKPGGYNVIGVLTNDKPEPVDLKGFFAGLFKDGELLEQYAGWEIIYKVSFQFRDIHPGGLIHEHAANEILARKPV